jgi:hypothetical protein
MDLLTQRASAAFYFFFFLSFGEKERERPPIEIVQNLKRALVYVDKKIKKGPDQTRPAECCTGGDTRRGGLTFLSPLAPVDVQTSR